MQELNHRILHYFITAGYKFLLYYNLDHFALIVPMMEECETNESSYLIPIRDQQAQEMALGIDEFPFYVLP